MNIFRWVATSLIALLVSYLAGGVIFGFDEVNDVVGEVGSIADEWSDEAGIGDDITIPESLPQVPLPTTVPPAATPTPQPPPGTARDKLAFLEVTPEHQDGYDRDLFAHWSDLDRDGCDTRNEILASQAATGTVTFKAGTGDCKVTGGEWYSIYDSDTLTDPGGLDIDHVVALQEAWDSGAWSWSAEERERFANDPFGLRAVSASSNRRKSADDPAEWIPANDDTVCGYVTLWIDVKITYELTIDTSERDALSDLLTACGG